MELNYFRITRAHFWFQILNEQKSWFSYSVRFNLNLEVDVGLSLDYFWKMHLHYIFKWGFCRFSLPWWKEETLWVMQSRLSKKFCKPHDDAGESVILDKMWHFSEKCHSKGFSVVVYGSVCKYKLTLWKNSNSCSKIGLPVFDSTLLYQTSVFPK